MATYLEIILRDSDERVGKLSVPVAAVALPAGYQAKIDAVTDALTLAPVHTSLLTHVDAIYGTRVVIDQAVINPSPPGSGDIRAVWELLFSPPDPANGTKVMRSQLPGRTDSAGAYDQGSRGYLVDQNNVAWVDFAAALSAAGVDVKVNYPTFASAMLRGARALTSRRRTTALAGGVIPGQATAISHLELLTWDANRRKSVTSIPVAAVALPAGYAAKITAVLDGLTNQPGGGVPLIKNVGMIWYTRVVIEQAALATNPPPTGDRNLTWRFQSLPVDPANGIKPFSWSVACRNTDASLTTIDSKGKVIDTSNDNFQSLVTALNTLGVNQVVPYKTDAAAVLDTAFALGRSTKAPNL